MLDEPPLVLRCQRRQQVNLRLAAVGAWTDPVPTLHLRPDVRPASLICGFVQTQADTGSVTANDERPVKPVGRNKSTFWRGLDGHGETCAARTPLGAAEGGPLRQVP